MHDLARFRHAQDDPRDGVRVALAELRAGHKRSHWIWYVFPQLHGLGHSPAARAYGIAGRSEAEAYLRDPVLRERLLQAATTVREQLAAGVPIARLMGSEIDVLKLVSSMTLFGRVAAGMRATEADAPGAMARELARLVDTADAILGVAEAEGFEACAFTLARLSTE